MKMPRLVLVLLIAAAVVAFFVSGLSSHLSLEQLQRSQASLAESLRASPVVFVAGFFVAYVVATALSLPGAATLLTLLAGALFGLAGGTVLVSFASSIGATLAFLGARFLFRDAVQSRFGARLEAINRGVEREGALYLFTLRLVPVFPFFLVNVLLGLTPIATRTFYWVSQVGMLLGTLVYVNVGTRLAELRSLDGLLSASLLVSFALLGVMPLVAKRLAAALRRGRVYAGWDKPKRFERNLVVIGAGSAGLVTSYIAATVKASVTLVERHRMGGDCLNTGCVPSKALIRTAKLLHQARNSARYGIRSMQSEVDFGEVMQRVQRVIRTIEPHDSVERYTALGVECVEGEATIVSPWHVEIVSPTGADGVPVRRRIATRNIVIAAGARPLVPPIPGLDAVGYVTSDTLWSMRELPRRMLVLGGGPIGCELAQAFARLGARVTVVEMAPRLMIREDPEVSELIRHVFQREGVEVLLGHRALRFERDGDVRSVVTASDAGERRVEFDTVLLALGRRANVAGYGLEKLGVPLTAAGTIEVDEFLQTRFPNIFACGDVAGPYQFTHTAAHMAWFAAVNALFGRLRRFRVDWSIVPWCTFTEPEVARVGLSEEEARARGVDHEVTRYGIDDLDRAIADEAAEGFVKVLTRPGSDRILGVTIVGDHAGDLIAEFVAAMKNGIGLNRVLGTIHIYPTLAEANKYAAGEWKRAHAPQRILQWLGRFHRWQLR